MKIRLIIAAIIALSYSCNFFKESSYDLLPVEIDKKWGYINQKGEIEINPQFRIAYKFSDGVARVQDMETGKYGFIDKNGSFVIQPVFVSATDFSEGFAIGSKINEELIIIDKKGNLKSSLEGVVKCLPFNNGLAAFLKQDKWGFIDTSGEIIIEPNYYKVGPFMENFFWAAVRSDLSQVFRLDTRTTIRNKKNEVIFEVNSNFYTAPSYFTYFSNGLMPIANRRLYGYINKNGNLTINYQFDDARSFNENLAAVKTGDKWGFIDTTGKYVIIPQYEDVKHFQNGLAAAKKDRRWGFIDKSGEFIIKPLYYNVSDFHGSIAFYTYNDIKYGIVNRKGVEISEPVFFEKSFRESTYGNDYKQISKTNIAISDFLDTGQIISRLLEGANNNTFHGFTSSTSANDILQSKPNLKINKKTITSDYEYINNYANIVRTTYNFDHNFVTQSRQYKTVTRHGYTYKEFIGMQQIENYSQKIKSLRIDLKLVNDSKIYKFKDDLVSSLKTTYGNLQQSDYKTLSNSNFLFEIESYVALYTFESQHYISIKVYFK